jgi:insulysin
MFSKRSLFMTFALPYFFYTSEVYPYTVIPDQSNLEIKTPLLNQRKTLKIQLKNGIKALIVSDPKITQSAAAVAVMAGSWDDPDEYPGMAHFCEHMLFMGNKKYPIEDDFFRYINDHGGIANAYTSGDHTVYLFSSNNDAFSSSLDRLSQFFIDPLFPKGAVSRELLAVDQENDKNIQNDSWRRWMVLKETGNPSHPNGKFSTGTAQTLGKIPIESLKSWFDSYYSAEGMTIVILSNDTPENLAKLVEDKFLQVPKRKHPSMPAMKITSKEQEGHLITIEPYKDLRILNLTWEIDNHPSNEHGDKMIAALISSRHEGSLFTNLNKEELASDLMAATEKFGANNRMFEIEISLTETGVKHIDQVIEKIFQYLQLLKANLLPTAFQKELKTMSILAYEYQTQLPAFDAVSSMIESVLSQPLITYPDHDYILDSHQQESAKKVLAQLSPENCIFFLVAKPELSGINADRTEKWYGSSYSVKPIQANQLEALEKITLSDELKLPDPNPLIPQNFTIAAKRQDPQVELLLKEPIGKLYYEQDLQFLTPTTSVLMQMRSNLTENEKFTFPFLDLLSYSFRQKYSAAISQAQFAGLFPEIHRDGLGLKLVLQGFSDKAKIFWHQLLEHLKNLELSVEEFEHFKNDLVLQYKNDFQTAPYQQAFQYVRFLSRNDSPLSSALEKNMQDLTLQDFHALKNQFLSNGFIEMFCYGNITAQDSIDFFEVVPDILAMKPIVPETIAQKKALDLKEKGPYKVPVNTPVYGNCALLMIQSPMHGLKSKAAFCVLEKTLKTAFFDTLRTKQQTGYITQTRAVDQLGFLQFYFVVQSTTHEPDELVARFELFLEDFLRNIQQEIPIERFMALKQEIIKELSKPEETVGAYSHKRFYEAFSLNGNFKENEQLIKAIDQLNLSDFFKIAKAMLSRSNDKRLAVCLEGEVKKNKSLRYTPTTLESFRQQQDFVSMKEE